MNCKKTEKFLIDYLYQELSAKKTVEVEKHLSVCDQCAKTVESWRAIHQGFHRVSEEDPSASPYLKQKLMIAAREELNRKPSFSERFMVLLKPAMLLPILIFAIATILYLPWQSHKVQQAQFRKTEPEILAPAAKRELGKADQGVKGQPEAALDSGKLEAKKQTDDLQAYRDKEANLALKQKPYPLNDLQNKDEDQSAAERERRQYDQPSKSSASSRTDVVRQNEAPPAAPSAAPEPSAPSPAGASEKAYGGALRSEMAEEKAPVAQQAPPAEAPPPSVFTKVSKNTSEDYFQQAQALFQQDDLKRGVPMAQQAVEHDGARALAVQFHQAGIQYQQNQNCEKAIPQFTVIMNNYRDYSGIQNVLLRLGDCYAEIGQVEAAKRIYTQLLQYPASRQIATQKIQQINKKIQSQQDLKALGYVNQ